MRKSGGGAVGLRGIKNRFRVRVKYQLLFLFDNARSFAFHARFVIAFKKLSYIILQCVCTKFAHAFLAVIVKSNVFSD